MTSSAIIVKTDPNEDLYLVWNRVSDGPEFAGDKLALTRYLTQQHNASDNEIKERINRANLQGTSVRITQGAWRYGAPDGHWKCAGFVYNQQGWLPRARLTAFARALIANEDETVYLDLFDEEP